MDNNRFDTNRQASYTNRVAQIVLGNDDVSDLLAVVTGIPINKQHNGNRLHHSDSVGADTSSLMVELVAYRGRVIRITGNGSLAIPVSRAQVGDKVRFSGSFNNGAASISNGLLARRPYLILSDFCIEERSDEKHESVDMGENRHTE